MGPGGEEMTMVKLSFRTTPETKKRLKAEAEKRGLTVSEMVRYILEKAINATLGRGPVVVQSGMED